MDEMILSMYKRLYESLDKELGGIITYALTSLFKKWEYHFAHWREDEKTIIYTMTRKEVEALNDLLKKILEKRSRVIQELEFLSFTINHELHWLRVIKDERVVHISDMKYRKDYLHKCYVYEFDNFYAIENVEYRPTTTVIIPKSQKLEFWDELLRKKVVIEIKD
jgi:DNA-binding PadR family transcriptional regulator